MDSQVETTESRKVLIGSPIQDKLFNSLMMKKVVQDKITDHKLTDSQMKSNLF